MLCHSCWFLLSAHALKETKWISSVRYFINFPQKYKMYILEQKNKRRKKRQCTKNLHRRKHSPEEVSAGSAVFFPLMRCLFSICFTHSPFPIHSPPFSLLSAPMWSPTFTPPPGIPLSNFQLGLPNACVALGSFQMMENKRLGRLCPGSFPTQRQVDDSGCFLQDIASKGRPFSWPSA